MLALSWPFRVPFVVRRLRRRRKLAEPALSLFEGLIPCAAILSESPAWLGHANGKNIFNNSGI